MHRLPPVADIMQEVTTSLGASLKMAERRGVSPEQLRLIPGSVLERVRNKTWS